MSREHLRDSLVREEPHVRLAQDYVPVVVQFGGARDLGAEPNVRIFSVHRRRGDTEDGLVEADKEPVDGRWGGFDEEGFYVVGARGLSVGLVQRGP